MANSTQSQLESESNMSYKRWSKWIACRMGEAFRSYSREPTHNFRSEHSLFDMDWVSVILGHVYSSFA